MKSMAVEPSAISLRLMTESDIPMLHAWLHRPHVAAWWADDDELTLQLVRETYGPRALAAEAVTPYIAMLDGRPVGYAQSYVVTASGDG
jgi:Acetyltransferase (GNAT) domain